MNAYGKLPQEQAMQTLIHDTNSALSKLRWRTQELSEWIKANSEKLEKQDKVKLLTEVEYFKSVERNMKAAIDSYYKKFEADFPEPVQ